MKTLIIYDTTYGNTMKIAEAMAKGLEGSGTYVLLQAKDATLESIQTANTVIVGSPTQAGRPTKAIQKFLDSLPAGSLSGKKVAAFDTRYDIKAHGIPLRALMHLLGFAAPRLSRQLQAKGGELLTDANGFFVHDMTGPLEPGEIDRARQWTHGMAAIRQA